MFSMRLVQRGKSLSQFAADLAQGVSRATGEIGEDLSGTMARRIHQRTGVTAESFGSEMTGQYEGRVTAGAGAWFEEYWNDKRAAERAAVQDAIRNEHGTRNQPPHTFVQPSFEEVRPRALERLERAVEEAQ